MEYELSETEAKVLVIASQSPIKDNYAELLALKLKKNSSYTAGLLRRLSLAGKIEYVRASKRRIIKNIDIKALKQAKEILNTS